MKSIGEALRLTGCSTSPFHVEPSEEVPQPKGWSEDERSLIEALASRFRPFMGKSVAECDSSFYLSSNQAFVDSMRVVANHCKSTEKPGGGWEFSEGSRNALAAALFAEALMQVSRLQLSSCIEHGLNLITPPLCPCSHTCHRWLFIP